MIQRRRTRADTDREGAGGLLLLESCSFTWIFDQASHRFRRVPRASSVSLKAPAPWTRYHGLEIDPYRSCFTVVLDRRRTRVLRVSLHRDPCSRCQGSTGSDHAPID
jgi:hypothetical protein